MDYISKLPEPWQSLAELRRDQHYNATCTEWTEDAGWMPDTLHGAFHWRENPEGKDFWIKVATAKTEADLPEVPAESMLELCDALGERLKATMSDLATAMSAPDARIKDYAAEAIRLEASDSAQEVDAGDGCL